MTNTATLVARPHPFSQRPAVVQVQGGRSIAQILEDLLDGKDAAPTLRVEVGGHEVPRSMWQRVKPKAGTQIAATVMPAGGGSDGNKWVRAVLMVVVIIVAWAAAPYVAGAMTGTTAALASAASIAIATSVLTMLGNMPERGLCPVGGCA